jgi:gliding motility-associated-like protein
VWSLDGVDVGEGLSWTWVNAQPGDHTITLTITTADGCSDTYTIDYFITPEDIVIPNVFTPNSDGLNDRFVIENVQYYRNELTIFNRWGQPIYEADNYRNQWGGSDVPDGTYYYVLRLTDSSREYTGHVTVLR